MSNYYKYIFRVTPVQPGSDILIASLADLGFESFEENEEGFNAYVQENVFDEIVLDEFTENDFTFSFEKEFIEQTNWNEEWEKNYPPIEVEDLLYIKAPFHSGKKNFNLELVITPKMSFGTGHHDTTYLMCKTMFGIDLKNKSVLDMGCGTGILAILAEKLGAKEVTGIDIEDSSIENSIENAKLNLCNNINFFKSDNATGLPSEYYYLILANINKNVLKSQLADYSRICKNDGDILLSGFFNTDVDELVTLAQKLNLKLVTWHERNNWAVIHLKK